jgi:hypothetical protein
MRRGGVWSTEWLINCLGCVTRSKIKREKRLKSGRSLWALRMGGMTIEAASGSGPDKLWGEGATDTKTNDDDESNKGHFHGSDSSVE